MSNLNIITVIAVILFARLGVRLFIKYRELKREEQDKEQSENNIPKD